MLFRSGDVEALVGTTSDHARTFHRERWRPDHAVLVIAGDVDTATVFAQANEWFSRWGGRSVDGPAAAAPTPRRGRWLDDLPSSPVTEVRLGVLAPSRAATEYPAWLVAREVLERDLLPAEAHATLVGGRDASLLVISGDRKSTRLNSSHSSVSRMPSSA